MKRKISFREDLRSKFIFFAIIPMFLLGIFGAGIVYNAEENLIVDNHNRSLVSIDNRIRNFYRKIEHFLSAVKIKLLISGNDSDILEDSLIYNEDVESIYFIDSESKKIEKIDRTLKHKAVEIDDEIKTLLSKFSKEKNRKGFLTDAYYSEREKRVLISYIISSSKNIYIFNVSLDRPFKFIKSITKEKQKDQSLFITNREGFFIFNSLNPDYVKKRVNFFKTGAYHIAVENSKPFVLKEFPENYEKGDSFLNGIFDKDNFLTYTKQKETGWLIGIRDYSDNLDPFLNSMLIVAVILITVSIVLTLISVDITTNRIVSPLENVINQINEFTKGDKSISSDMDPDLIYPIFENLMESFKNMKEQISIREEELKKLNRDLERIVEEKTKDLHKLNRDLENIIDDKIKENIEIQKKLTQNEKLASMGEMIGNIAHQWRQPLSAISTSATGIKTQKEFGILEDEEFFRACDDINENAQYLSRTIDDFRNFIKGDKTRSTFKLKELIESFLNIIDSQLRSHNIDLVLSIDESIEINGYKNDLIQSMINIFNNSKDALRLKNVENKMVSISGFLEQDKVKIEIFDNGDGIDEEILNRIFEPYFTTKHKSQGTGLGLHMTHKLIKSMGGEIEVENVEFEYRNRKYKGAKFTISLPSLF